MRADRPLIGAILFLAAGLGLICGYCHGTTAVNLTYPLAQSQFHLNLATYGPAVLGGIIFTAIGLCLLVWSFLAALVCQISLLAGREPRFERIMGKYEEPEEPRRVVTLTEGERKPTLL